MTFLRIAMLTFAISTVHAEEQHHEWDYGKAHGPQHWGAIKPEFATCGAGKAQSPIDIRKPRAGKLEAISFDYRATPLRIIDNGHTVQVNYAPGSTISIGDRRYELQQFHFHKPSEEKVNGKSYPMVAHLVHKNADGALAVVAVLLSAGAENPVIKTLWSNLPPEKEKEDAPGNVSIDAAELLPKDHAYYSFPGSLTTPPCSEGVTWYVLVHPSEISEAQVARFGKIYAHNARPVQPLNGRVVQISQ